jgi:hypothetical protein
LGSFRHEGRHKLGSFRRDGRRGLGSFRRESIGDWVRSVTGSAGDWVRSVTITSANWVRSVTTIVGRGRRMRVRTHLLPLATGREVRANTCPTRITQIPKARDFMTNSGESLRKVATLSGLHSSGDGSRKHRIPEQCSRFPIPAPFAGPHFRRRSDRAGGKSHRPNDVSCLGFDNRSFVAGLSSRRPPLPDSSRREGHAEAASHVSHEEIAVPAAEPEPHRPVLLQVRLAP